MKISPPTTNGIAFGLSQILGERMRLSHHNSPSGLSSHLAKMSANIRGQPITSSAYLVTRCPGLTIPILNADGVCSCGLPSSGSPTCATTSSSESPICVEDLRHGKRHPTCGLEVDLSSRDPDDQAEPECPDGFMRLVTDPGMFICQDMASPHSCGLLQQDCSRTPGALSSECVFGECQIVMCKEGWRFKLGAGGQATCVLPPKPYFFSS
ncbi:hypothetical protein T439DRAFT_327602 [Meredithblackwellia eburnea MCA 4105]